MASLGFRHPQFSEELAWLPAWLQPHKVEASDECQINSSPALEDLDILQGNIFEVKDVDVPSREEGRYNSCHLFLSGEDNSLASSGPSSEKVFHFHLHLSSNGASQCTQTEFDASQAHCDSTKFLSLQQVETLQGARLKTNVNKVLSTQEVGSLPSFGNKTNIDKFLSMKQIEISSGSQGNSYQSKSHNGAGGLNLSPLTSFPKTLENLGIQSPIHNQNSRRHCKDKFSVRYLKGSNINNAVELSISASEALVIHELVHSELASEALPTAAILEATLRVKEARLEGLEDGFDHPNEEIEETDLLFDLDDLTMADAYEDVGLSFIGPSEKLVCCSNVSLVKETPFSENHYGCDNGFKRVDFLSHQNKFPVNPALGLDSSHLASNVNPLLRQSANEVSKVFGVAQKALWYERSKRQLRVEVDVPVQLEHNNSKRIQKFFVNETSFLSESAYDAPDENSIVQKREMGSKIASQSSVPFEGFYKKPDEAILVSQELSSVQKHGIGFKRASLSSVPGEGFYKKPDEEILISQDLSSSVISLVDPLCSVVPCSVSTANNDSPQAQNQNDIETDGEKQLCEVETLQSTPNLKVESVNRDRQDVPTVTGDGLEAPVQRRLTSLRIYSTLLPNRNAELQKGSYCHNRSFLSEYDAEIISLEQNMGGIRHLDKKCSGGFLPSGSASKYTISRENEETYNNAVISDQSVETTNYKKRYDEHAKDGAELPLCPLKESRPPLIINQRTRCRLHASKLVHSSIENTNLEEAAVQGTTVKLHKRKNYPNTESELNKSLEVPVRKRVHFSEVEVEPQKINDVQKLLPPHKIHPSTRASNRLKYSNAWLASRTQGVKKYFSTGTKDGKRLIFHGMKFLLTGFPTQKEKEIEVLVQEYGGMVLLDVPSPNSRAKRSLNSNFQQLPIVLCPKKLKTRKFLYGCAVNAVILKVKWLTDSIAAGSIVLPEKYTILSSQADAEITGMQRLVCHDSYKLIFDRVGIMLHGKNSFCTKFAIIIKHGGGQIFKTLQWLVQSLDTKKIFVGAIVAEDEIRASRHLRQFASERDIPMVPSSWIIKSLHSGKLLPSTQNKRTPLPTVKVPESSISLAWSEEI